MTEILEIFSLLLNTDKFQKCQTPEWENFPLTYYYNLNRAKWPEMEPEQQKKQQIFFRLTAFAGRYGGRLVFSFYGSSGG